MEGLTRIGEGEEYSDERNHLEKCGDGAEAVSRLLAADCNCGGKEHSRRVWSNVLLEPGRLLRLGPALQLEVLHRIVSCLVIKASRDGEQEVDVRGRGCCCPCSCLGSWSVSPGIALFSSC